MGCHLMNFQFVVSRESLFTDRTFVKFILENKSDEKKNQENNLISKSRKTNWRHCRLDIDIFLAIVSKYAKRDPKDGVSCPNFQ